MRKLLMLGLIGAGAMMFGMEKKAKADHCYRGGGFGASGISYGYSPGFYGGGFNRGFVGRRSGFSLFIGSGRRGIGFNRGGFRRGFNRGGFGRRGFGNRGFGRRGGFRGRRR